MIRNSAALHRQRGAALLLLMLGVILATATVLAVGFDRDALRAKRQQASVAALAKARDALLDYAVVSPQLIAGSTYGLPCPDIDSSGGFLEGEAHAAICGAAGETVLGRLPWRTLGMPAPKDGAAECLWYVVSGSWKHAGAATSSMINADSNGQLQLASVDTGALIEGINADDRPVAAVIAGMAPVGSQSRPAVVAGMQCSDPRRASDYLEADAASGSDNARLLGAPDVVDVLGLAGEANETHNDRIVLIRRSDIARRIHASPGFEVEMRDLGLAAASCMADYAARNPGGPNDLRLPWPAPVALADYRTDPSYDDVSGTLLAGRLADVVDSSNALTTNTVNRVLTDCDPGTVPAWTADMHARWQRWKDHFYYAVAGSYAPDAVVPSTCTDCLTVNGGGSYAAVLAFGNRRLDALGQVRNEPPLDADTKAVTSNYLEDANAANIPGTGALRDYVSQAATTTFNDMLFCIDGSLIVSEC